MIKIENALSNDVYKDKNKIIKKYKKDKFKKIWGNQESKIISNFSMIKIIESNKNYLVTEYIDHKKFNSDNVSLEHIYMVSESLKKLHKINSKNLAKSNFQKVYEKLYLKNNDFIDDYEEEIYKKAIKILHKGKQVVLHNDVVPGNMLLVDNEIILIDFEYGGIGNPIFDLASFITENKLSSKQIEIFINSYGEKIDLEQLLIVSAFLQIFWTRWAILKYKKTNKSIYMEIANWKFKGYKKIIKYIYKK